MTNYTQSTDRSSGIFFGADGDKWTIAEGIAVVAGTGIAVEVGKNDATLVNHGYVFSGNYLGNLIGGDNFKVVNADDGLIIGYTTGVLVNGNGGELTNRGVVKGITDYGVLFASSSGPASFDNTGKVFGKDAGVRLENNDIDFSNDGLIRGDLAGVQVHALIGDTVRVLNEDGGQIKGPSGSGVSSTQGAVRLDNHGLVTNGIDFNSSAADKVFNHGTIKGETLLGLGDDRFDGHDGVQAKVFGESGADRLIGGAKADILNGGADRDVLFGKGGADDFDFDSVAESMVSALHDVIRDFKSGVDDIDLSTIDAIASTGFNDAFIFRGKKDFTAAGQVRYELIDEAGKANDKTMVYVNVNADLNPDMQIESSGLIGLKGGDFIL